MVPVGAWWLSKSGVIDAAAQAACAAAHDSSTTAVDNCVGKQGAAIARSHGDWLCNTLPNHQA
jgi:hypothetical protein